MTKPNQFSKNGKAKGQVAVLEKKPIAKNQPLEKKEKERISISLDEAVGISYACSLVLKLELPYLIAFRLGVLADEIEPFKNRYFTESEKIAQKYGGTWIEQLGMYNFGKGNEENREKYIEENRLLSEEKIEVNMPNIPLESFEGLKIKPEFFRHLGKYMTK